MSLVNGDANPDQALFRRVRAGDEQALRGLFDRYSDQLVQVAHALLRDADAARDVVQEVFIALWNGRARRVIPDDVGRYLRRSVRNRALKAMARRATAARTMLMLHEEPLRERAVYNAGPVALETAARETAIAEALASLQPRTREIFLLARAGLRSGEIADLLEISAATVYNQLSTALRLLARRLAGWDDGASGGQSM